MAYVGDLMRCKIHASDSGAGVCACCLRERLSTVAASIGDEDVEPSPEGIRKSNISGSNFPDVSRIRTGKYGASASGDCGGGWKQRAGKLSHFSPLCGHPKLREMETYPVILKPSRPNSWVLALIGCGMWANKKKTRPILSAAEENALGRTRKPQFPPVRGWGLSPASEEDVYETEPSLSRWLSTPSPFSRKPAADSRGRRSFSNLTLCLSPLVRPIDNRQSPAEIAIHSELPGSLNINRPHYASGGGGGGSSLFLLPNRSRKLSDFGKVR